MARKKTQQAVNTDDMSVMDWWRRFQPQIANERVATDGLSKHREALELIVAPHLTTRKTHDAIHFKGKQQYVKPLQPGPEEGLIWAAIFALQCLYKIEDSISAGDMNAVIHWTYGFTLCEFDVQVIKQCGWDAGSAVARSELDSMMARERRRKRAKGPLGRRGQSKLQAYDGEIKTLHSKYKDEHRYMKRMLKGLSDAGVVASDDTLRTRLKQLGLSRK